VIASGALLVALPPEETGRLLADMASAGLPSQVIGRATTPGSKLSARRNGAAVPYPHFVVDEIARIFG